MYPTHTELLFTTFLYCHLSLPLPNHFHSLVLCAWWNLSHWWC